VGVPSRASAPPRGQQIDALFTRGAMALCGEQERRETAYPRRAEDAPLSAVGSDARRAAQVE